MSGDRSHNKGKRGDVEFAAILTAEGFDARRGQQHRGGPDSPDVIVPSLPSIHFEAKRTERLSLYDAVAQARRDAGDKLPIVAHRRNASEWVAILTLTDLLAIIHESSYVETTCRDVPGESPTTCAGIPDHDLQAVEVAP